MNSEVSLEETNQAIFALFTYELTLFSYLVSSLESSADCACAGGGGWPVPAGAAAQSVTGPHKARIATHNL